MAEIWDKQDKFFMDDMRFVSPLESVARKCMERARRAKTISGAMIAQSCAIDIRSMEEWSAYI